MVQFAGKVAIVTGAAEGMGAATARRLIAGGARVCLVDRNEALLKRTVAAIDSPAAFGVAADISSEDDVRDYVASTVARFGRLDLLHNNAGITGKPGNIIDLDALDIDRMFRVNFYGTFFNVKAAVPHMKAAGGGAIVNMSSLYGIRPALGMGIYGASKGAVISLTKTLSIELAPYNIRVNTVAPGAIETTLLRSSNAEIHDPAGPSFDDKLKMLPFGRPGTPDEAANMIAWLLSDEASYISGSIHYVDGALGA